MTSLSGSTVRQQEKEQDCSNTATWLKRTCVHLIDPTWGIFRYMRKKHGVNQKNGDVAAYQKRQMIFGKTFLYISMIFGTH